MDERRRPAWPRSFHVILKARRLSDRVASNPDPAPFQTKAGGSSADDQ